MSYPVYFDGSRQWYGPYNGLQYGRPDLYQGYPYQPFQDSYYYGPQQQMGYSAYPAYAELPPNAFNGYARAPQVYAPTIYHDHSHVIYQFGPDARAGFAQNGGGTEGSRIEAAALNGAPQLGGNTAAAPAAVTQAAQEEQNGSASQERIDEHPPSKSSRRQDNGSRHHDNDSHHSNSPKVETRRQRSHSRGRYRSETPSPRYRRETTRRRYRDDTPSPRRHYNERDFTGYGSTFSPRPVRCEHGNDFYNCPYAHPGGFNQDSRRF